jgi:ABC-type glycerol-3-phosphate transport system substrate-binding protein
VSEGEDVSEGETVGCRRITRRSALGVIGATGLSVAAGSSTTHAAAPMTLRFWSNDQPQQRGYFQKRFKLFTEQYPNIRVDYQWFPAGELGKKISVGFATGTAPDGFVSFDWLMPVWLDKNLLAPLDLQRLGYASIDAFRNDHAEAAAAGAMHDGKLYGFPSWAYAFLNYINTKHFKEVGLDPERDAPKTWDQFGEAAKRLTKRDGGKMTRQGAKFAMHVAQWTMLQFNPILLQCGGEWFDANGKCTLNSEAGVKAMTIRASLVRQYGAEDPADTIATNPLPMMDWLKERSSMFLTHPVPPSAIVSQNATMEKEHYYRPIQCPGVEADKTYATTFSFNLVVNSRIPQGKKDALQDVYKFVLADPVSCWHDTAPFTVARKSGWADHPSVKDFPDLNAIIRAKDNGVFLPRSLVYNELTDALHRAVQNIALNNGDIRTNLDEATKEIDRATAAYKRT